MAKSNLERLIQMADEVFDMKNDPHQLNVNQTVLRRLEKMHPSTVSEDVDGNGPVAWVLVIPTTSSLMNQFLENKISEKELFDLTPLDVKYEALYLCSALVLEEYRRMGITKRLVLSAIENIRRVHPLRALFVWPFTEDGGVAAERIAALAGLPLFKKRDQGLGTRD
jgi:GNAT superfamily N-acetyltransferase